jgi:hypothetical protein
VSQLRLASEDTMIALLPEVGSVMVSVFLVGAGYAAGWLRGRTKRGQ